MSVTLASKNYLTRNDYFIDFISTFPGSTLFPSNSYYNGCTGNLRYLLNVHSTVLIYGNVYTTQDLGAGDPIIGTAFLQDGGYPYVVAPSLMGIYPSLLAVGLNYDSVYFKILGATIPSGSTLGIQIQLVLREELD